MSVVLASMNRAQTIDVVARVNPLQLATSQKGVPSTAAPLAESQPARQTGEWLSALPAQQGFDQNLLETAAKEIGQMEGVYSLLVVRNGYLVVEQYFREGYRDKPHNLKSASKSLLSALIGIAIDEGQLRLDQPINDFLPEAKEVDNPRKMDITVRHLLTMTSGLKPTSYKFYGEWTTNDDWIRSALDGALAADPGTSFQYSTGNTHLLSAVLTAATNMSTREFAVRKLFDPMNIVVHGWATDPNGIYQGGNNLSLIPRDMAKIGQLYLDGGKFSGRQLISKPWIDASTRGGESRVHDVYGHYGYLWYARPGGGNAFVAVGYGGQYIYVAPTHDSVIVVTSTLNTKGSEWEKHLFDLIHNKIFASIQAPQQVFAEAPASEDSSNTPPSLSETTDKQSDVIKVTQSTVEVSAQPSVKSTDGEIASGQSPAAEGVDSTEIATKAEKQSSQKPDSIAPVLDLAVLTEPRMAWAGARLNLRSGPSAVDPVIVTLEVGTALELKEQNNAWFRVKTGNLDGWVAADYVQIVPPEVRLAAGSITGGQKTDTQIVQLKGSLVVLQDITRHLDNRLQTSENTQQQMNDELTSIRKGLSVQRDAAIRSEKARKALVLELASARTQSENTQQQITDELTNIRRELSTQRDAAVRSETARKTLALELASARTQSESTQQQITDELTNIRKELSAQRDVAVRSEKTRKALALELASARTQSESTQQQITDELTNIRKELSAQRDAAVRSETARKTLALELTSARTQIETMGKALEEARAGNKVFKAELSPLRHALETQQDAMAKASETRKQIRQELAATRAQFESIEKSLQDLGASRQTLTSGLAKLGEAISNQELAIDRSENSRKSLVSELAEVNTQLVTLGGALKTIQTSGENISTELATLRGEISDLETEVKTSSKSERLIAKAEAPHTPTQHSDQASDQITTIGQNEQIAVSIASPESPDTPVQQAANSETIAQFIQSWSEDWQRQDIQAYLAHYSKVFRPSSGTSLAAWSKKRKNNLLKPKFIEITIDDIRKTVTEETGVRVTFNQIYRSDVYTDRVVKTLELLWEDATWKISRETSNPQ